ncbi:uncharacterized protein [Panulirus ornatus]|uniref:uncharacterized protein isoform X1 n=1 Tax=Panulirus ornatus TaxID=150431 RepID=UPI003A860184
MVLQEAGRTPFLLVLLTATLVKVWGTSPYDDDVCYAEKGRGLRLQSFYVDKYLSVRSLKECEKACDVAFFSCKSFSYSEHLTRENENCLLSREGTETLDLNNERNFYSDRDFNYYVKSWRRDCVSDDDDRVTRRGCYDLVKTRERIDRRFIIQGKVLRTRDRRECEQECDQERRCKGFNYRFKTLGYDQYRDNCELSSQDASSSYDFTWDDDFDFYEKKFDDDDCYAGGGGGGGGGGGYGNHGGRNECFRLAETETAMEGRVIRDRFYAHDIRDCERECERSRRYTCKTFTYRYNRDQWRRENCYLSDQEYRDMSTFDLVRDRDADFYERRLYDRECSIDDEGANWENEYSSGEGRTVVTGARCYRGYCKRDRQGGYYFCETDHSGAWDYCCRPRERCGRSEGFETLWCYVGIVGRDQWRPCIDYGGGRDYLKEGLPPGIVLDNGAIIDDNSTTYPTI